MSNSNKINENQISLEINGKQLSLQEVADAFASGDQKTSEAAIIKIAETAARKMGSNTIKTKSEFENALLYNTINKMIISNMPTGVMDNSDSTKDLKGSEYMQAIEKLMQELDKNPEKLNSKLDEETEKFFTSAIEQLENEIQDLDNYAILVLWQKLFGKSKGKNTKNINNPILKLLVDGLESIGKLLVIALMGNLGTNFKVFMLNKLLSKIENIVNQLGPEHQALKESLNKLKSRVENMIDKERATKINAKGMSTGQSSKNFEEVSEKAGGKGNASEIAASAESQLSGRSVQSPTSADMPKSSVASPPGRSSAQDIGIEMPRGASNNLSRENSPSRPNGAAPSAVHEPVPSANQPGNNSTPQPSNHPENAQKPNTNIGNNAANKPETLPEQSAKGGHGAATEPNSSSKGGSGIGSGSGGGSKNPSMEAGGQSTDQQPSNQGKGNSGPNNAADRSWVKEFNQQYNKPIEKNIKNSEPQKSKQSNQISR